MNASTTTPAVILNMPQRKVDTLSARALRRFRRHRLAVISVPILVIIVVLALAAPILAPRGPNTFDYRAMYAAPGAQYLLGTDSLGRDGWARLLYGGRVSLSVGLVVTTVSFSIGIILGAISGYLGGFVDLALQRFMELVNCTPQLILVISFVAILNNPNIYVTMFILGVLGWTGVYRFVRGQILSLREEDFILSARCMGAQTGRIILRHILPNVIPYLVVQVAFVLPGAILTETSLSFLGLGVRDPTPSWGNIIGSVRLMDNLEGRPWMWLPAGFMITTTVLCINFIGDALRDALDPREVIGK